MKQFTCLCILMISSVLLHGQQNAFFKTYSWETTPTYSHSILDTVDILGLKDKVVNEFIFEDESFIEYHLEHKAYLLNSDERIEEFNKIYLPYKADAALQLSKARVIKPNGEIITLDESKILTAEDQETKRVYKYFAFEGIEKGSIIEYMYVIKRAPEYSGNRINFQRPFDKKQNSFDLYAPANLVFTFKSYNGLPAVVQDTTIKDKLHWSMECSLIKGLEEETQAPYNASLQFLIYKLDENLANNTKNITSYSKVSQNLYNYYYQEPENKTVKNLSNFLEEAGINQSMTTDEKLRTLEHYIKTSVYVSQGSNAGNDLDTILEQKVANDGGILKLFIALFKLEDIKHHLILTSDRQDLKFDQEFEANTFLNEFLFYFPETEKYMAPTAQDTRYGFPNANWTDTYGLVIKEVSVGDFKSAVGNIAYINPVEAEKTVDKMNIAVHFDSEDLTHTSISYNRSMGGYYAMYMQPFMNLVQEEDKTELLEGFAKTLDEDATITSKKIKNDVPELFGVEPLQFLLEFESEAFVEKAGNRYLFKVGDLIGQQIQMYQENARKLPLEDEFKRMYFRTITVTIPEGYQIANADDLNLNQSYSLDGDEVLMFKSSYEIDGNSLTITADEFYKINKIDPSFFEEYRTVINSAADFNKVTLVIEPI